MAIQRTLNSTGFGGNHFMHCVKETAKAAGWTVSRGGTGTGGAFREDGVDPFSGWDIGGTAVSPELGVGNCWFCLKAPVGSRELLFVRHATSSSAYDGFWWVGYSPSGAYAGGDATTKPTAADEVTVSATGTKAVPAGTHNSGTTANIVHVAADDAASPLGEYGLIAVEIKATNSTQAVLLIDDLRQASANDTDAIGLSHGATVLTSTVLITAGRVFRTVCDPLVTRVWSNCVGALTYTTGYYVGQGRVSVVDLVERALPITVIENSVYGYRGLSRWLYQAAVGRGYPNTGGSLTGLYLDDVFVPEMWDGVSIPVTI